MVAAQPAAAQLSVPPPGIESYAGDPGNGMNIGIVDSGAFAGHVREHDDDRVTLTVKRGRH